MLLAYIVEKSSLFDILDKFIACIKLNLSKNIMLHIVFKVEPLIKRFVSFCRKNMLKYVHFMSYLQYRCTVEKNLYYLLLHNNIFQKCGLILCKKNLLNL